MTRPAAIRRSGYDNRVATRMIDFFTIDGMPWPRRLWDIGSLLALEELHEAGGWEAHKVLTPAACDWQRQELRATIGPDVGLGDRELRRELTRLLNGPVPEPSPARRQLKELIDHARTGYVNRWAKAVVGPAGDRPRPERLARTVAAHLLDLGYDAGYLLPWASDLNRNAATASETIESAASLATASLRSFDVLAVLLAVPERNLAEQSPHWLSKSAVIAWLRRNGFETTDLRVGGGFRYEVVARDVYGAAHHARQQLERMVARSTFLRRSRGGIHPADRIWVAGHASPVPFATPARGADLLALVKEEHLYRVGGHRSLIDDALELAAPINRGPLGPAVAGAWAALESLLTHPDDPVDEHRSGKAVAADRLAAIIACSWPRAELTVLSHRHNPAQADELSVSLSDCTTNLERAKAVASALTVGRSLDLRNSRRKSSDQAAVDRVLKLLGDPRRELAAAARIFRIVMRRLYRARNIVLHGGSTTGVAIQAALRTAAPLFGAGFDRLVHAALAEGIHPLELAARAEVSLRLVDGETGLSVAELLEPRAAS